MEFEFINYFLIFLLSLCYIFKIMFLPDPTDPTHISAEFFAQIPELKQIQQAFKLSEIENQVSKRDIDTQFELLRVITQTKKHKLKLRSNTILENKRNRYPEQSIFEHSRVKLINNQTQHDGENKTEKDKKNSFNDYINANYVYMGQQQNKIILSQAPLRQTASDMLKMIAENQISLVVMLCNVIQNGKQRCFDYLNQTNLYEDIELLPPLSTNNETNSEVQLRKITLKSNKTFYKFTHLLFTAWPDKSVPDHPAQISPILQECVKHNRILIHCSAGLGRSGVIAGLYRVLTDMKNNKQQQGQIQSGISIFRSVRQLREDRFGAVQNNQQYRFLYQYMQYYHQNKLSF